MSKEIDFSKAPEGATHYYTSGDHTTDFYKFDGDWKFFDFDGGGWEKSFKGDAWCDVTLKQIPRAEWTIHNNTKPLKDLEDWQAAELFNAWRSGEKVEISITGKEFVKCNNPSWVKPSVYRIKQKSERELFVEACTATIKSNNSDGPYYYDDWFEQLFEAGCRFKD